MSKVFDLNQQGPLQFHSEVELSPFFGKFSPSEAFRIGNVVGGLPIGNMDNEFMKLFLPIPMKKPLQKSPSTPVLRVPCWDLLRNTCDTDIFTTWLGSENRVLDVARVFQIMSLGQKGPVLLNNLVNAAFVIPVFDNKPRTMYWNIYMGTWHINLVPGFVGDLSTIKYRPRLPRGSRFFGGVSPMAEEHEPLAF